MYFCFILHAVMKPHIAVLLWIIMYCLKCVLWVGICLCRLHSCIQILLQQILELMFYIWAYCAKVRRPLLPFVLKMEMLLLVLKTWESFIKICWYVLFCLKLRKIIWTLYTKTTCLLCVFWAQFDNLLGTL